LKIFAGTTSETAPIYIQNIATGAGLAVAFNASGLVAEYRRAGSATWTSITLATGTIGTWSSGGWTADGGLTGAYEVGIPNAAIAAGATSVVVRYYGAANMAPVQIYIELDAVNYQSATAFVTSVPAVVGSVGSVTGAVGSVAGNVAGSVGSVAGNVSGSVASVVGAVASVTGAVGSVTAPVSVAATGLDLVMIEAGINLPQMVSYIGSAAVGVGGPNGSSVAYAAAGNPSTPRVSGVVSNQGYRTSITLISPAI
jgi:hypothetical protein